MKGFILGFLIATALPIHAAPPANPADFPLMAHVIYSRNSEGLNSPQHLDAMIDGQAVELTSLTNSPGVLKLGDYPVRVSTKNTAPKSWKPYDQYVVYDLLLPDGKVRSYYMTGIGTPLAPGHPE